MEEKHFHPISLVVQKEEEKKLRIDVDRREHLLALSTCKSFSRAPPTTWCWCSGVSLEINWHPKHVAIDVSPSCSSWAMASAPRVLIDCHVIDWLCCATPIQRQIKRDQSLLSFLRVSDVALIAANGTEEQPFWCNKTVDLDLKKETKSAYRW